MTETQQEWQDENRRPHYEDEISLVDLWLALARRKWIILGVVILSVALGTWYASGRPVLYEYRSGIELARIYDRQDSGLLVLLSSREGSVSLLEDLIIPTHREKTPDNEGAGPRINVLVRGDSHHIVLRSVAQPDERERVEKLHEAVAVDLSKNHSYLLERDMSLRIKPLKARIAMLQTQAAVLEKQLGQLSDRSHDGNDVFSLIDAQQMSDLRRELAGVRLRLTDTVSDVEAIREASHGTRIRFLGIQSEDMVGPNRKLIIALSLAIGLILGVFAAFFGEFIAVAKAGKRR
jgi:uncharacterized protein involved in exopolysaccharide biosynthesis